MPLKNPYLISENEKEYVIGQPGSQKTIKVAKTADDPLYPVLKATYLKAKSSTGKHSVGEQTESTYTIDKPGKLGLMVPKPEVGETDPVLERLSRQETPQEVAAGFQSVQQMADPLGAGEQQVDTARIPGQGSGTTTDAVMPLAGSTTTTTPNQSLALSPEQAIKELNAGGLNEGANPPVTGETAPASGNKMTVSSQTSTTSMGPEGTKELEQLKGTKNELRESMFKAEKVKIDRQIAEDTLALKATDDIVKEQEKQANEFQTNIDNAFTAYETAIQEYGNMSIDSERLWKTPVDQKGNKIGSPKANKIMAAIAVGLGTFGSHITGGENVAYRMINNAIDRDIEEQKFNITRKGHEVALRRGAFADLMDKFKSENVATGILKEAKMRSVHKQLTEMYNKMPDDEKYAGARASVAKMIASIEQPIATLAADNSKKVITSAEQSATPMTKDVIPEHLDKRIEGARESLSDLSDIKNLISSNKADTGLDEAIYKNLVIKLGFSETEQVDLNLLTERFFQRYKVLITGAGSSAKESTELRNAVMSIRDNPKAFLAKIQILERKAREGLKRSLGGIDKNKYKVDPAIEAEAEGSQAELDDQLTRQGQK